MRQTLAEVKKLVEDRFIGIELRSLNNAVRRYLETHTAPLSDDKITCTNAWIIGFIDRAESDVYQRDLEYEFGITRSTASKVLILLEKKGLIKRVGVSHDARLKKLVLTEKAQQIADRMKDNGARMESRLTKGFTEQELSALANYMQRMRDNLSSTEKHTDTTEKEKEI